MYKEKMGKLTMEWFVTKRILTSAKLVILPHQHHRECHPNWMTLSPNNFFTHLTLPPTPVSFSHAAGNVFSLVCIAQKPVDDRIKSL